MAGQTEWPGETDLVCRIVSVLVENEGAGNAIFCPSSICAQSRQSGVI